MCSYFLDSSDGTWSELHQTVTRVVQKITGANDFELKNGGATVEREDKNLVGHREVIITKGVRLIFSEVTAFRVV